MTTWLDLAARAQTGQQVRFVRSMGQGALAEIPEGTVARIVDNSLNEMGCAIIVKVDEDDGEIFIPGPLADGWGLDAPIELID